MADFCKQCAHEMFPPDCGQDDFVGLSTEEDTKNKLYASALCECCGFTQVDHAGFCIHHKESDEGHKYCRCGINNGK